MKSDFILKQLSKLGSVNAKASLARFGIKSANAHGIPTPVLKQLARTIGKSHSLALELWKSGNFEARAVAAMIDEPDRVTRGQMDRWTRDFDSWAICDCCCCYLFRFTPYAWEKAVAWSRKKSEYVKRAGFSLMAYLAVHDKQATDQRFAELLPIIERESDDSRNFVRKAVNWALRQIGKRNKNLNRLAIRTAEAIKTRGTASARWIAADALRELRSAKVQARLPR